MCEERQTGECGDRQGGECGERSGGGPDGPTGGPIAGPSREKSEQSHSFKLDVRLVRRLELSVLAPGRLLLGHDLAFHWAARVTFTRLDRLCMIFASSYVEVSLICLLVLTVCKSRLLFAPIGSLGGFGSFESASRRRWRGRWLRWRSKWADWQTRWNASAASIPTRGRGLTPPTATARPWPILKAARKTSLTPGGSLTPALPPGRSRQAARGARCAGNDYYNK
eukprot:1186348-Prorocentrum_minimum.AAC.5